MIISTCNAYCGKILTLPDCDVVPWNIDSTSGQGIYAYKTRSTGQTGLQVDRIRSKGKKWVERRS